MFLMTKRFRKWRIAHVKKELVHSTSDCQIYRQSGPEMDLGGKLAGTKSGAGRPNECSNITDEGSTRPISNKRDVVL